MKSKVSLNTRDCLACAYTPGVTEVCFTIAKDKKTVYDYTLRNNLIAVITDSSRVLDLENIGPEAALSVMEGKAILFKEFGLPRHSRYRINYQDRKNIALVFGAINLEDIVSLKCFEIEEQLKKELNIPVFHDDQEGIAIAILAGFINTLKISKRNIAGAKIILSSAGAADNTTTKLLTAAGVKNLIVCDTKAIYKERTGNDKYK